MVIKLYTLVFLDSLIPLIPVRAGRHKKVLGPRSHPIKFARDSIIEKFVIKCLPVPFITIEREYTKLAFIVIADGKVIAGIHLGIRRARIVEFVPYLFRPVMTIPVSDYGTGFIPPIIPLTDIRKERAIHIYRILAISFGMRIPITHYQGILSERIDPKLQAIPRASSAAILVLNQDMVL